MIVDWDYSGLADAYARRPGYAREALVSCPVIEGLEEGARVCDVGAGTGHLTSSWLQLRFRVVAVEPNRDMRRAGRARLSGSGDVGWLSGYAESLPVASGAFDLVSFGSSLNVTLADRALSEAARVVRPGGGLVCAWNHRQLDDLVQRQIQRVIEMAVPGFSHGTRRSAWEPRIAESGWFENVSRTERAFVARTTKTAWLEAWKTHLSLARQAGEGFAKVLADIGRVLDDAGAGEEIGVPYVTRVFSARRSEA